MGASKVALTASQLFWRAFQTKEQRAKSSSNVSTEYSNVEVDEQGFLLVTTSSYEYWQYKQNKIQAEVLAKAIIENTEDGPMDYWAKNEMSKQN